jgi:hypothetical protein
MAFGDAIATISGSIFGPESRGAAVGSVAGGLLDLGMGFIQNRNAQRQADAEAARQREIQDAMLGMSQRQYADERAIRDRVLARVSQLDEALKGTLSSLGPRVGVNASDVANNYQTFRTQIMDDYNRSLDRISSQGFADAISRGMDRSTQMTDERRQLAEAAATNLPRLDQAAFDAAIARSKGYADTLNYGRADTMDEMKGVFGAAIDAERGLITNNAPTMLGNAAIGQDRITDRADVIAGDSQTFLGDALGRFTETVAPNVGYALTGRGSFVTPRDREMEAIIAERDALRARVGG